MTLEELEQEYLDFQKFRASNPQAADSLIKLNQSILIAAGRIHSLCLIDEKKGKEVYDFFTKETFAGMYYAQWRKNRAIAIAHCLSMYATLGVNLGVKDIIGETFYAGIPPITREEVKAVNMEYYPHSSNVSNEKIGIDGKMHPTDEFGHFLPIENENDIYGDNTNVKLTELGEQNEKEC